MREQAVVVRIEGNEAEVVMEKKNLCRRCGLCSLGQDNTMVARVKNLVGARVNDRVEVEIEEKGIVKAAFIVYLFPLAGLIGGFILGSNLALRRHWTLSPDSAGGILGFTGLVLVFAIVYWYDRKISSSKRELDGTITRVLGSGKND